jgi:hypothetical protein
MLNSENNYKNDFYKTMLERLGPIEQRASYGNSYSKFDLKKLLVPGEKNSRTPWLLETGSAIRTKAVFEAHESWKTNIGEVLAGRKRFFNLTFKSKRDLRWGL